MSKFAVIKSYHGKSPEDHAVGDYLTEGKKYPIVRELTRGCFTIKDDAGLSILCRGRGCMHLGGGTWEIIEKRDGYGRSTESN